MTKPNNYGKFDRTGSTFMWQIVFYNGREVTGYSKPKDQAEPHQDDRLTLLRKCLDRILIKNQYLKKIQSMTVYRCFSNNDIDNKVLVTIYPANYVINNDLAASKHQAYYQLKELMDSYYANNQEIYGDDWFSPNKPSPLAAKTPPDNLPDEKTAFDLSKKRFYSARQLEDYCELLKLKYPTGRISHFMTAYTDKYFFK